MSAASTAVTTRIHRVCIHAAPQEVRDAITRPEWARRYGSGVRQEHGPGPDGTADPTAGLTRVTWEIEEGRNGVTKLTVIHELDGAPTAPGCTAYQKGDHDDTAGHGS